MQINKIDCDPLSDQEIVAKSIADLEYFRCLFEKYEVKLKMYINKISSLRSDEVDDVMQDAFIKIWKNLNNYDPAMKLSSFLYRIVHNETISHWRKKSSMGNVEKGYNDMNVTEAKEQEEGTKDLGNNIHEILNSLSPKYKDVLVLKFLENMDYEEISNILKIPEGTVATRINRAKKAFAKESNLHKNTTDFTNKNV